MAKVKIFYEMNDGEILSAQVQTDQDHPDALTDCANRAVAVIKESLTEVLAIYREHIAAMAVMNDKAPE